MSEDGGSGMSRSLELLWGLREPPRKGPKPGLSLARVVDAAVQLADEEGLEAVSMGRLAERLGFTTMSLYRYVASKDELFLLMRDAAAGAPPPLAEPVTDWRAALGEWSWAQLALVRRHPWIVRLPITGPPLTPSMLTWMDSGVRALAGSGLLEPEKVAIIQMISGMVLTEVRLSEELAQAYAAAGITAEEAERRWSRTLARVVEAGRFPGLAATLASGMFDEPDTDPDAVFHFSIERLLDGIEVLTRSRQGAGDR